jgi:hypothetical protein
MMRSFADVLALWTPLQLSRVLAVPYSTAATMYQRGSIGPKHWSRVIAAASARGEIITADMLVKFADHRRLERSRARSPAHARCAGDKLQSAPSMPPP